MGMTPAKYFPQPTPYGVSPQTGAIGATPPAQGLPPAPGGPNISGSFDQPPPANPDQAQLPQLNNIYKKLPYQVGSLNS